VTPSSRRKKAKKRNDQNVERIRTVALETKWEDTSTIISKVHGIPPLKAAVDDKYFLLACLTLIKLNHCFWQFND